jgi:hypothetical protein
MSRNLSTAHCYCCSGVVKMDEPPRRVTEKDVGNYYETRDGYGFADMIAAHASCVDCKAKYLAWVNLADCVGYGSWYMQKHGRNGKHLDNDGNERGFYDLSFRSTFNDEPGPEDMPDEIITREWVITSRAPWPMCPGGCGFKSLVAPAREGAYCPVCFHRQATEKAAKINAPGPEPFPPPEEIEQMRKLVSVYDAAKKNESSSS